MKDKKCRLCQRISVKGVNFKKVITTDNQEDYVCTQCIEKGRLKLHDLKLCNA